MFEQLLIAIDFDGTIVEHDFPRIGKAMPGAFETMRDLIAAGHRLMLNTCREDEGYKIDRQYLTEAVEFCRANGVEFVSINQNAKEDDFRDQKKMKHRKIFAHVYIDDRNLGGFLGWDWVRKEILGDWKPDVKKSAEKADSFEEQS